MKIGRAGESLNREGWQINYESINSCVDTLFIKFKIFELTVSLALKSGSFLDPLQGLIPRKHLKINISTRVNAMETKGLAVRRVVPELRNPV